jgi:DNA-directed RNA polymerase subunit K/omega
MARRGTDGRRLDDNMIDRSKLANSFEFIVAAGARARQLLAGSTPRVAVGEHKKTTVAQKEIVTKAVETIKPGPRQ